jgi:hypothetical protein
MTYYKIPGQFLVNTTPVYGPNFAGTDTKELFEINLKKMPGDWHYRHATVSYDVNSDGYRELEFSTINWNDSVVIFGCSHVFGIGLAQEETLSARLSQLLGVPVVNMGIGASSIYHAFYNQVCLKEMGVCPRAIVNVWTSHHRLAEWRSDSALKLGPWSPHNQSKLFAAWNLTEDNPAGYANLIYRAAKAMHNDTPQYHMTFFDHVAEALDVDFYHSIDKARDLIHVGPQTILMAAQKIIDKLKI